MDQGSFELFFQQIRQFLTVQEQVDLYGRLERFGSSDASFLSIMALAAAGFSQRKPERIHDARHKMQSLVLGGLDLNPLLGCMDLLLGDVDRALEHVHASPDDDLQEWLANYPSDDLAALFDYCRSWLGRDVLPGYRDVDAQVVDLDAWFADRDVQAFVERLERKEGRSLLNLDGPVTTASGSDWTFGNLPPLGLDPEGTLPLSLGDPHPLKEKSSDSEQDEASPSAVHRSAPSWICGISRSLDGSWARSPGLAAHYLDYRCLDFRCLDFRCLSSPPRDSR